MTRPLQTFFPRRPGLPARAEVAIETSNAAPARKETKARHFIISPRNRSAKPSSHRPTGQSLDPALSEKSKRWRSDWHRDRPARSGFGSDTAIDPGGVP